MRKNTLKKIIGIPACLILAVGVLYVMYVIATYKRIPDNQTLTVSKHNKENSMQVETAYTAASFNIGFGAYTPEFTFFMDGGRNAVAESRQSVLSCVNGAAETAAELEADFMLFQELDLNSDRSYHVNQKEQIDPWFQGYDNVFAINYDSAYLFFPPWEPHGKSFSCQSTYSRFPIEEATRYSLPISKGFNKFLDLDRCYLVTKIPVENGRMLCLYHVHLSAYGNDASIRSAQIKKLMEDMAREYKAGNYVICGGDFNHDMEKGAEKSQFGWAQPFPREELSDGFFIAADSLPAEAIGKMTKSTRNADIPYDPKESLLVTVDGFILSENIELLDFEIKDEGFRYSDHNPIVIKFRLKA